MGEYPGLPFDNVHRDKPFELVYQKSYTIVYPWNFQDCLQVILGQFQGPLPSAIAAYTPVTENEELCKTLPILKPPGCIPVRKINIIFIFNV